jgi:hypothetical protein
MHVVLKQIPERRFNNHGMTHETTSFFFIPLNRAVKCQKIAEKCEAGKIIDR